ncbi:MAG: UDP-N-acetylmuramoyl-L-alanyl-D-glutamate--2,6-diaminopimelate ligase [Planctomycetota bacterium]|nr:UDP-N-acetylmuramoyl-L-alanyl-D-glutamate--2,6-diaminopimelate ligase [Planctomycetota bacterium]
MPLSLPDLPSPVSLRRLLPGASFVGCGDVIVNDATDDSRLVTEDSVFAAICGTKFDGRDFATDAVANGCSAVLTDRPLPNISAPQCVVPDVRAAYARICNAVSGKPTSRLKIAGITGTNGKTTSAWMLRSILNASNRPCGLLGTIEYSDGKATSPASLTTPDPRSVFRWFRRMIENGCRHAAIELSSHALSQNRIAGTPLAAAIITNVTQDHFDYHSNFEIYLAAKAKILDYVVPGGIVAINLDDPGSAQLCDKAKAGGHQVVTFSTTQNADVRAEILDENANGSLFRLSTSRLTGNAQAANNVETAHEIDISIALPGRHNVLNSLGAAAAALHLGASLADVQRGLERLIFIPGRLERINCGQPFSVFVDYAHTDDALQRVIDSLSTLTTGRILCVFGAGGDRDRSKRPLLGKAAASADFAIVTSDNPRTEEPQGIIEEVVAGFPHGYSNFHIEPDRYRAIEFALAEAQPGDCVLIAGKGHESDQVVGKERLPFDDRLIAREILEHTAFNQRTGSSQPLPTANST